MRVSKVFSTGCAATDDRDAARFLDAWGAFIGRWGFLGPSVWEFRSADLRDRPRHAAAHARSRPPGARRRLARDAQAARLAVEREAAVTEIQRRLSGNPAVLGQFTGAARNAGRYLAARESGKLHCAMLIDAARGAIRELGRRLVQRGQLARWEDVLLVTDDEADDFVADPVRFGERIADRAVMLEVLRSKEPPFVFVGDPPPLEAYRDRGGARVEPAPAGTRLQGIGVSPGRHTGRARIITTLDVDTELQPGEVIVAVATDSFVGAAVPRGGRCRRRDRRRDLARRDRVARTGCAGGRVGGRTRRSGSAMARWSRSTATRAS
jgi:hypothetical protein